MSRERFVAFVSTDAVICYPPSMERARRLYRGKRFGPLAFALDDPVVGERAMMLL